VANVGVQSKCSGQQYIELRNTGSSTLTLDGYFLHIAGYPQAGSTMNLPFWSMPPGAIFLFCRTASPSAGTFTFTISPTDTVTLRRTSDNAILSMTGAMPGLGSSGRSYQRSSTGSYFYAFPTPEMANAADPIPTRAPAIAPMVGSTGKSLLMLTSRKHSTPLTNLLSMVICIAIAQDCSTLTKWQTLESRANATGGNSLSYAMLGPPR
jgi:hypothetical protein